jgi:hypothetical protein
MKSRMTKLHLADLSSDNPRVKYGRAKSLVAIAEKRPDLLYPHLAFFVKLLKSENNILKWTAIDVIGSLSSVDKRKKIDKLLNQFYGLLEGGKLITANHAISALAGVALAKPAHQTKIIARLLNVEHLTYETDECRNIALGKVVQALGSICRGQSANDDVVQFVRRQTTNSRPATRKKAQKFLKALKKA